MLARFRSLLRAIVHRRRFEAGMADELRYHIEQYEADLLRSGVSPREAHRRARLEFGGMNTVEEECREARGLQVFDEFARQLNYALRVLRKTPAFALTALLTVALCLGANLTVFAVIDAILIRPLPFPQPDRLVTVFNTYPKAGVDRDGSSVTNYYERRGRIPALSSLSIYRLGTAIVGETGSTQREQISQVSPEFFSTLGVQPAFGRVFTDQETTFRTDNVAILTNDFWREHFSADPHAIGRPVRINGIPKTVIGVLPRGFRFLSSDAKLYVPLASRLEDRGPRERHSGGNVTQMIARLAPGATLAQAQSQIDAQNASLERDDPQAKMIADAGFRSLVVPLHADHVASIRPTLLLLQAGVLILLLIGIVNLTNLFLIRANARTKEIAVRQALGASRSYIASELMVETSLITLLGGVLGLSLGECGIRLVEALGAGSLPLGAHITLNPRLALLGLGAALVMGIVLALPVTAFHLRRSTGTLQTESRSATSGRTAHALRQGFVIAQMALAFVLLSGAGLLGLSLERVMAVSPGFQPDRVLTAEISLVGNKYPSASAGLTFIERLTGRLSRYPGVLSDGVANNVPFSGHSGKSAATVEGYVRRPGESARGHYSYGVAGDYFRAMGFSLRAGRWLTSADSRSGKRVCVVDEDFARYYWPNSSALGHRLFEGSQRGPDSEAFTVVGVVGSVKQAGLTDEAAQGSVYYPYIYRPDSNIFVAVRAGASSGSLALAVQRVVRQIDPELAVNDIRWMDDRIADSLLARRSPALLAGLFSAIALLLAGIGTYGVLSYAVAQRNREIGIRIALGAQPGRIRADVLMAALRLFLGGAAFGLIGALFAGKAMQAVLFHVPALSPLALAGSAGLVASVSAIACLLPALRAARVSPMRALADQ